MKAADIELVSTNDVTDHYNSPTGVNARYDYGDMETPAKDVTNVTTGESEYQLCYGARFASQAQRLKPSSTTNGCVILCSLSSIRPFMIKTNFLTFSFILPVCGSPRWHEFTDFDQSSKSVKYYRI